MDLAMLTKIPEIYEEEGEKEEDGRDVYKICQARLVVFFLLKRKVTHSSQNSLP